MERLMTRERFSRRTFFGLMGGTLAIAAAAPALALAQADATPSPTGAIEHPTGANDLVLRVEVTGGFVPPQVTLSELPQFSLYGDGRAITTGPTIEIYPAPALPNLRQIRLTEAGIQEVLAAAKEAGLLDGDKTYFNNIVADAPTTVFTVVAGGKTTIVSAYALGIGDDPNWTAEERAALAKLQEFAASVLDVKTWIDPANFASEEAYPIERLQIVAQPIDLSQATPDSNDPTQNQPPLEWPLSTPLTEATPTTDLFGSAQNFRCGVIAGEDAATLVAAAQQANALTPWVSEGTSYLVSFRPLLPDETGCPPRNPEIEASPVTSS
jgi:hypothetical protein